MKERSKKKGETIAEYLCALHTLLVSCSIANADEQHCALANQLEVTLAQYSVAQTLSSADKISARLMTNMTLHTVSNYYITPRSLVFCLPQCLEIQNDVFVVYKKSLKKHCTWCPKIEMMDGSVKKSSILVHKDNTPAGKANTPTQQIQFREVTYAVFARCDLLTGLV